MPSSTAAHQRINLRSLYVPSARCISVRYGEVESCILNELMAKGYDQAPVVDDGGEIVGIVATIELEHLQASNAHLVETSTEINKKTIATETTLNDLLDALSESRSVLVNNNSKSIGIVTISDLNKHPLRSAIYPLFATLETELATLIAESCTDPWEWIPNLGRQRRVQVLGSWEVAKRAGVETDPLTGCMFTDLIEVFVKNDTVRTKTSYRNATQARQASEKLPKFRNKVMHPVSPLVLSIEDVTEMRETIRRIEELIVSLESRSND
jgi:hypothetical protein